MTGANWDDLTVLALLGIPYVVTQLKGAFRRKQPQAFDGDTCRCDHASVFHTTRGCHKTVTVPVKWDEDGDECKWEQRERECLRYASRASSYMPEIDGLPGAPEKVDAHD